LGTERRKIRSTPAVTLLCCILKGSPSLPDAACRNQARLFDGDRHGGPVTAEAQQICLTGCRSYPECAAWINGLRPDSRPRGVIAGQFRRSIPRKRKETTE
jgi:hypothetical protein